MNNTKDYIGSEEYNALSKQINKAFDELSQFELDKSDKTFKLLPKSKILVSLWKILGNIIYMSEKDDTNESRLDLRFYSVEVTDKLNECISTYINQNYADKDIIFSEYLISIEKNNIYRLYKGGHQTPDPFGFSNFNYKKVYQIKRVYKNLLSYGLTPEETLERTAKLCNVSIELAKEYWEQSQLQACSKDDANYAGMTMDINVMKNWGHAGHNMISCVEYTFFVKYEFECLLNSVQYVWKNEVKPKHKKCVSQMLTAYFLEPYTQAETNPSNGIPLTLFNNQRPYIEFDWVAAKDKYSFLDKGMIDAFPNVNPSYTEIAARFNLSLPTARAQMIRALELAKKRTEEEEN